MLNFLRHIQGAWVWVVTGLRSPELGATREKHKKGPWQEGKRPAKGIRGKRGVLLSGMKLAKITCLMGKAMDPLPLRSLCFYMVDWCC